MRRCAHTCLAGLPALVLASAIASAQPLPAGAPPGGAPAGAEQPATDRLAPVDQPVSPPPVEPVPPVPAAPPRVEALRSLDVQPLKNDDGKHLQLTFERPVQVAQDMVSTIAFRRKHGVANAPPAYPVVAEPVAGTLRWSPDFLAGAAPAAAEAAPLDASTPLKAGDTVGPWTVAAVLEAGETSLKDEVAPSTAYEYVVVEARRDGDGKLLAISPGLVIGPRVPEAALFHTERWGYLLIVLLISGLIAFYIRLAKARPKEIFIRRMPGVDALEDAVGRSTEMGRPVLYVTGLEEIQDIMTIASLLILGHVAELTAHYDTEIKVANYFPLTMVVAEEIVRQGYANAGRADAHRPENVLFITAEQFAFAAGVNGIILRDKPATNIYFGKFFGESLLLAETGYMTGAIQIAGTAELPQLPFFIAACDYTLIGEELYATSAYLSREPTLLANLKAGDAFKLLAMLFIVVGTALATAGVFHLAPKVFP